MTPTTYHFLVLLSCYLFLTTSFICGTPSFTGARTSNGESTSTLPSTTPYSSGDMHCRTASGCRVYLSVEESDGGSDSSGNIIGGIVGPIVFAAIVVGMIPIIAIIAVVKRRRRMLALAAAAGTETTTTTTHQPFVPVPLATATTTTTENTTMWNPPVVAVALQQPSYNPNLQPYNPYQNQPYYNNIPGEYGNPTYTNQPASTQFRQTTTDPYQKPNETDQTPSYFNPGVGVHPPPSSETVPNQHDPTPAYNPNIV